jgi:hypothetical protein
MNMREMNPSDLEEYLARVRITPSAELDASVRNAADEAEKMGEEALTEPDATLSAINRAFPQSGAKPRGLPRVQNLMRTIGGKSALAAGLAGLVVCGVLIWLRFHSATGDFATMSAFSLFRQACAAEESLFAREGITSIFNEIIIKPRTGIFSSLPASLPMNSLGTSGKFVFDMLSFPAKPGEPCTVEDRSWRDQATGRFVRVMTIGGKAIYANAFDGSAIYRLQPDAAGVMKIAEKPVAEGFHVPESPAELLGITAGFAGKVNESAEKYISDAGPAVLPDGSAARVVKVTLADVPTISAMPEPIREMFSDSYSLYTIRKSDNTVGQLEFVMKGQSLIMLRRMATRTVEVPGVPWNLSGVAVLPPQPSEAPPAPPEAPQKGAKEEFEKMSVSDLRRQAVAAAKSLFAGEGVLSLASETVVEPVKDAILAKGRYMNMRSLGASGKPEPATLALPAKPGEQYALESHIWYDRKTGRFARVVTIGGETIFANAYDGSAVYAIEPDAQGVMRVVGRPVAPSFQPLKDPADFLGVTGSLDEDRFEKSYSDAGPSALPDGSPARVVKLSTPEMPGMSMLREVMGNSPYKLFTIRKSDFACVQIENVMKGERALVTRLKTAETVAAPGVPWNLGGVKVRIALPTTGEQQLAGPILMGPSASVQQMSAVSDYKTYLFAADPPWTTERRIMALRDPTSALSWMFVTAYRAKDGRHVVLVQAAMYNKMFEQLMATMAGPQGEGLKKNLKEIYASPSGFKVWSMMKGTGMGAMILTAARDWLNAEPLSDSAGYLVQTPAGTFPALAVNGSLTDDELHALIDSLVPAKEYLKKPSAPAAAGSRESSAPSP